MLYYSYKQFSNKVPTAFISDKMHKSAEYQNQYLNLRSKVENNIQDLQTRLSNNNQYKSKVVSPNYRKPQLCHHHHCHHHCHHIHCQAHSGPILCKSTNYIDFTNNKSKIPSQRQIPIKTDIKNQQIMQMLSQNLRNQKEINSNIKIINQRMLTLNSHRDPSSLSSAFVQKIDKRNNNPIFKDYLYDQKSKYRCKSQMKDHDRDSQQIGPMERNTIRKVINKISEHQSPYSQKMHLNRNTKIKNIKPKTKTKPAAEYLISFDCPIHSPNKTSAKHYQKKQVYKDSEHRNRKHEKNHLLNSFEQQQRSRRRLLSKIASEVFSQYGKK